MGEGGGVSSPRRHGKGPGVREHVGKKSWKSAREGRGGGAGRGRGGGVSGGGWGGASARAGWGLGLRGGKMAFHSDPMGWSQTGVTKAWAVPRLPPSHSKFLGSGGKTGRAGGACATDNRVSAGARSHPPPPPPPLVLSSAGWGPRAPPPPAGRCAVRRGRGTPGAGSPGRSAGALGCSYMRKLT